MKRGEERRGTRRAAERKMDGKRWWWLGGEGYGEARVEAEKDE